MSTAKSTSHSYDSDGHARTPRVSGSDATATAPTRVAGNDFDPVSDPFRDFAVISDYFSEMGPN
jgi:hypothetical protein